MSNQEPLISYQQSSPSVTFYDPDVILDLNKDKIEGFQVLLRGDSTSANNDANVLAFMALTDGNIVDACLGAPPQRREGSRYLLARDAKNALADASGSSDGVAPLAVETYKKGFNTVLQHQRNVRSVLFCCRCFVQGRMRRRAKSELKETFKMLSEAVSAAS